MRRTLLVAFCLGLVPYFDAGGSPSSDWPDIGGRYELSLRDVQQIVACVLQRADVRKPIAKIEAWYRNQAEVHCGPTSDGATASFVKLVRKDGKWSIVSVEKVEVLLP